MKEGFDIYDYDRKLNTYRNAINKANITKNNKELLFKFEKFCILKGFSKARILKYFEIMKRFGESVKNDFDKITKTEMEDYILTIQQNDKISPWTKATYRTIIKRFYKWMNDDKEYPEIVKWIPTKIKSSEKKMMSEKELISEEEIHKVINTCDNIRDKALMSVLFESGCRVGEIATLQIKDVNFDEHGVVLTIIQGKTGSRKVRMIATAGTLANWMENHPLKEDINAPVWINLGNRRHHQIMNYPGIRSLIIKHFKKVGFNKRCNPHLFRHSRATLMASHLTEFQMNQYFGWQQGSEMPSTYVHMSGRDLDGTILKMNGIQTDQNSKESKIQPQICPRCQQVNSFNNKYCQRCGTPTNLKTISQEQNQHQNNQMTEQLLKKLLANEQIQKILQTQQIEL